MTTTAPADTRAAPARRSSADEAMRRLLVIPDRPGRVTEADAHRLFSTSMLLSALRCLLSYVLLPVITPLIGAAAGVGPVLGIPIAVVALVFDVRGIRRFWLVDHKHRWPVTDRKSVV